MPNSTDCILSGWGNWSRCEWGSGQGKKFRSRDIVLDVSNGGMQCDSLTENITCGIINQGLFIMNIYKSDFI